MPNHSNEFAQIYDIAYTFVHAVHVIKWLFLLNGSNHIYFAQNLTILQNARQIVSKS